MQLDDFLYMYIYIHFHGVMYMILNCIWEYPVPLRGHANLI